MPKNLRFDARRGRRAYDGPTPDLTRQLQRLVTEERPGACLHCPWHTAGAACVLPRCFKPRGKEDK